MKFRGVEYAVEEDWDGKPKLRKQLDEENETGTQVEEKTGLGQAYTGREEAKAVSVGEKKHNVFHLKQLPYMLIIHVF